MFFNKPHRMAGAGRLPAMVIATTILAGPQLAAAQSTETTDQAIVQGRVVNAEGEAVAGADVSMSKLRRASRTDDRGAFRFDGVPAGSYLLEVASQRHGAWAGEVTVAARDDVDIEVVLEHVTHREQILVTASGFERGQLDLATPTNVLTGDELQVSLQPTLGETLAAEPGVNSTYFGPGASRPIVRGLGGDRVRMLEGGLDVGDVSSASPDHNVSTEPAHAERIEVLRGPATLLYGSSAIGGVVNVIDGLIPSVQTDRLLSGQVDVRTATVNDEVMGSLSLGGEGGEWGWHVQALRRDTEDYEIPGFAEVSGLEEDHEHEGDEHEEGEDHTEEEEHEEEFGSLANSDLETTSVGAGVSRFFDRGFVGVSVSGYDSDYGVPGGGHEHGHEHEAGEEEGEEHAEEEEGIRIDMQRRRADLRAESTREFGVFQGLKARLGVVDYEHDEVEASGEIGTTFVNDAYEARLELVQGAGERHSGSWGLQASSRELEAIGDEAFIPKTDSLNLALFTFQELTAGDFLYQFGARFENQDNDAVGQPSRSFSGASASAGVVWEFSDDWALAGSLARSVKFPSGEELYTFGPHFATQAFEIGNPDLEEETSVGLDLSLRRTAGRVTGEITLFRNDFSDYISPAFTGEEEDELPVLAYSQADAEFTGAEVQATIELWRGGHGHLDLDLFADSVRAELTDSGEPLPRIPPRRIGGGLHFHSDRWTARAQVTDVDDQDRLGENETPTAGYTMVNASVGYRVFTDRVVYDLLLAGRNLTDEDARNHVSFLKDSVPLPSRDLSLALKVSF